MNPPEISVIIINYNGGAFLQEAVNSLGRQTFQDFELIVLDNASADGSADMLDLSGVPAGRLIRSGQNLGFAAGNNRAAEGARGKWLVLLNPDTVAEPDWLEKLEAATRANPSCKTFASAQLDLNDGALMDGAGDAYFFFGIPWRGGFGRPASELPNTGWCFSACGASAMYDSELFRQMGGFDERFFCYCEDVDLGFRLQLAGHDCLFVHDAVVHHAGSGITGRQSTFSTYYGTRNRLWTYFKNMPLPLMLLSLPGHIVLTLYVLARNSFTPRFVPMVRGIGDGLSGSWQASRPGKWKQSDRHLGLWPLLRRMAWNPCRLSSRRAHVRPCEQEQALPTQLLSLEPPAN
ncbi:glycosyl transferase, group 2 family protein [Hyphomonas neptunium ATCC 15444]|uniref:Glycosyl transferase, group 2 family protein n=2 Tax=Hyphomonas TaxID=85 RepID=Q0C411_HYPNA|nr:MULTISPECIES: glycosyltransferase family 2 protein [Hyphomonas]ABI76308.1 glycosyl transferase, group 2 family protein [Hyphomonas neptunium ATCC 15444]KCZ96255.1 glycosyl transferase group 2 family protein [Hyphomonas hirschiana VP5]